MIRNVVLGRLPADADQATRDRLDAALAGIGALGFPGLIDMSIGLDAGLRAGGWSFAITNDWTDVDSYRAYDSDPEHNAFRAIVGSVCAELARVQFEVGEA